MSIKRIIILSLIILSIALAISLVVGVPFTTPPEPPAETEKPQTAKPAVPPAVKQKPAPTQNTAPTLPSPMPPLDESGSEYEEQTEEQQLATAREQLNSANPEQRIEGAEQLAAFPSKETEALLAQVLATDPEAEVRNAAVQSLGYVESPTDSTIDIVMAALEDRNEDVRTSALSTLEDFMVESGEDSKRYGKILAGLKAKAASRATPKDMREAIRDVLEDQTANP
jgi:hypothetical protein